ncbi:hypothetical protein LUZ60_007837 [Juncus effusus]|nr:hypothetical protein LUZ60_007837 [Juncus effusus]
MVGTPSSSSYSSSSCASFGSFDDVTEKSSCNGCVKFLCSYGGKILPRYPDGKLRYVGGDTRVLSVDRSLPFSEVEAKMKEMCGYEGLSVRCQIPTEDLDALVSVTSDQDLANLVEEYDLASRDKNQPLKIRAFLLPKSFSPPSTPPARIKAKFPMIQQQIYASRSQPQSNLRCVHQMASPAMVGHGRKPSHVHLQQPQQNHHHHESRNYQYLVHHSNHWQ